MNTLSTLAIIGVKLVSAATEPGQFQQPRIDRDHEIDTVEFLLNGHGHSFEVMRVPNGKDRKPYHKFLLYKDFWPVGPHKERRWNHNYRIVEDIVATIPRDGGHHFDDITIKFGKLEDIVKSHACLIESEGKKQKKLVNKITRKIGKMPHTKIVDADGVTISFSKGNVRNFSIHTSHKHKCSGGWSRFPTDSVQECKMGIVTNLTLLKSNIPHIMASSQKPKQAQYTPDRLLHEVRSRSINQRLIERDYAAGHSSTSSLSGGAKSEAATPHQADATQESDVAVHGLKLWIKRGDYYVHKTLSGYKQTEHPGIKPEVPAGWEAVWDSEHELYYYRNSSSNVTQWEHPSTKMHEL